MTVANLPTTMTVIQARQPGPADVLEPLCGIRAGPGGRRSAGQSCRRRRATGPT